MATTFNVIFLGQHANIDTIEGNRISENATVLEGKTFGDAGFPLKDNVQSFSPGGVGYAGGNANAYDGDNIASNDQFSIDGGPAQTYDNLTVYLATITYTDGTQAEISAVIFQDTDGNTYLAPEINANTDDAKLNAKPIQSLRLDSVMTDTDGLLYFTRQPGNFMVCFARSTQIATPYGPRPIETLERGDQVSTLDHGPQPIRWIGVQRRLFPAADDAMVMIEPGALGDNLPTRQLCVTRQHRILVRSRVACRMFGRDEVLVPAHRFLACPGVRRCENMLSVEYWHILLDRHEIIFANGAPAESLLLGDQARHLIGQQNLQEIKSIDAGLLRSNTNPARLIPTNGAQRTLLRRIVQNGLSVYESYSDSSTCAAQINKTPDQNDLRRPVMASTTSTVHAPASP